MIEGAILLLFVAGWRLFVWYRKDTRDRRHMDAAALDRCHVPGCLREPKGVDAEGRRACKAHGAN